MIATRHLIRAKHEDIVRFALWLGLYIPNTMWHKQLARLIKWRISLHRYDMLEYYLDMVNAYGK
jgi:hypothetical protein